MHRNCYEVVVLREPLERVASFLHYQHDHFATHEHIRVLEQEFGTQDVHNFMCKMLSAPSQYWNVLHLYAHQKHLVVCDLQLAKRSLANMDHVLFLDEIESL